MSNTKQRQQKNFNQSNDDDNDVEINDNPNEDIGDDFCGDDSAQSPINSFNVFGTYGHNDDATHNCNATPPFILFNCNNNNNNNNNKHYDNDNGDNFYANSNHNNNNKNNKHNISTANNNNNNNQHSMNTHNAQQHHHNQSNDEKDNGQHDKNDEHDSIKKLLIKQIISVMDQFCEECGISKATPHAAQKMKLTLQKELIEIVKQIIDSQNE